MNVCEEEEQGAGHTEVDLEPADHRESELESVDLEEHEHGDLELHVPLGRQLFSFQNNDGLSPLQCSALLSNPTILLYLLQSVSIKFGRLLLLTETRDGNNIMHCA